MSKHKHPKALNYLFFTEMWERFGYYLMIGIFTLYLKDVKNGFSMTEEEASDLYGTFIAFVFLTPFIGGLLADRVLGYRKSIIIGGILMGVGYTLMSVHNLTMLYISMTLIVLGNGFFKPNISTLLGNVYNDDKYKGLKDAGYNIFYMGINVGAFICNFFGAVLYNIMGWGAAFVAAGIGMFIGVIIFLIGTKNYKHADVIKPTNSNDMPLMRILSIILLPSVIFGLIGFNLPKPIIGSHTTDAFLFGCIPVVFFYVNLYIRSPKEEKSQIGAMLTIFAVVVAFWAVFKQNGSTLNTWADRYTDREVPSSLVSTVKSIKLAEEINYKKDSVALLDSKFRVIKKGQKVYDYPSYFKNTDSSYRAQLSEGQSIYAFNTNLFQSVNPFWVVLLTPLVVAFFTWLTSKGIIVSTPSKIAWGLFVSALSCLVMVGAVYASQNGMIKSSPWWFISSYAVITVGELFLSPMGLSLVSKLSPARLTSLMMGGWFLATSIGNKLSGVLSSLWDTYDNKANFFWVNTLLLGLAALVLFAMLKNLNKTFKQHA
jgi:proton-dependent oligopeptide transporter, POT family